MRVGWLSDIHLNFLDRETLSRFFAHLTSHQADLWLLGGDIGEAESVVGFLRMFETALPCKTYFALGNHDFYGGALVEVRRRVREAVAESQRLVWLTESEPQLLDGRIGLVGEDGWGDARFGDPHGTPVELNDFYLIKELTKLSRSQLVRTLNRLGDAAAARLAPKLQQVASSCERVIVLTHVPPFREATWHQGRPSDDDWVPWFSCRAVGETILACANAHPDVSFLVLCGHTHGSGVHQAAPNVTVHTAEAEYGVPCVQRVFDIDRSAVGSAWLE